ncbi:cytochrome P450 [Streptomyces sp. NPDC088725]|uniref:cytochrome P450 n=1 Tax=Streptomyces sp. NPDC088725 TaxID=3365873 RepID=UPI0037F3A29C
MEPALATLSVDRRSVVSLFSRLRTAGGQSNPLPFYAELRAMGDIFPAPWGGHLVTSYTLCKQVLRDRSWQVPSSAWRAGQDDSARWDAPASRQMGGTLPMLNPPDHTRMRNSMGRMFDRKSLAAMKDSVDRTTEKLLDRLTEELRNGEADFNTLVCEELPVITIGEWLGIPPEDYPLLRQLTHDQVFTQELFPSPSQLMLSDAATHRLREYFTGLVRERRKTPGDDPVSTWIRTWDGLESDQAVADEAVYSLALFVVLAALETTAHLLATMVWLLLENPGQMELLRRNPEHIPDAVEEVLRYDPPIHMISRIAAQDTVLAGTPIRENEMVQLMVGAAHHDPLGHENPETFDIRRTAMPLSFGGGIHYCLGAPLARLEATSLLTSLLRRLPGLRLSHAPSWAPRVAFRRLTTLKVVNP